MYFLQFPLTLDINNLKHFNATYFQEVELQDKSYKYHNDYLPLYAWIHHGVLTRVYSIVILLSHNWLFIILRKKKRVGGVVEEDISNDFLKVWGHYWHASRAWAYVNVCSDWKKTILISSSGSCSDTVLPLLLLGPGWTSISCFSVGTQHPPSCSHSQRTRPRMKPTLRREQGQGMEKQRPWQPSYPGLSYACGPVN